MAANIPETVLKCRATSTTKKYLGAYKRWKVWATSHKLPFFPAEIARVALYLQHLKEIKYSRSAVEEAVNALGWVHTMAGKPSPASIPFVQSVVEGMKRELAMPIHKKLPFPVEMLKAIADDTKQNCSLVNLRLASACLLAFAGFLRFDELYSQPQSDQSYYRSTAPNCTDPSKYIKMKSSVKDARLSLRGQAQQHVQLPCWRHT